MRVKHVMTQKCEYISPTANLQQAAKKMRELDCGFLPIGEGKNSKLEGVITDRDIVVRAIAEGCNPEKSKVQDFETRKVLYCFENDTVENAADSMCEQQVYRLIVLDNPESKRLCGIITLGDILRHNEQSVAAEAATGITSRAA